MMLATPMPEIATFELLWRPLSYLAPPNCIFVNGIDAVLLQNNLSVLILHIWVADPRTSLKFAGFHGQKHGGRG